MLLEITPKVKAPYTRRSEDFQRLKKMVVVFYPRATIAKEARQSFKVVQSALANKETKPQRLTYKTCTGTYNVLAMAAGEAILGIQEATMHTLRTEGVYLWTSTTSLVKKPGVRKQCEVLLTTHGVFILEKLEFLKK